MRVELPIALDPSLKALPRCGRGAWEDLSRGGQESTPESHGFWVISGGSVRVRDQGLPDSRCDSCRLLPRRARWSRSRAPNYLPLWVKIFRIFRGQTGFTRALRKLAGLLGFLFDPDPAGAFERHEEGSTLGHFRQLGPGLPVAGKWAPVPGPRTAGAAPLRAPSRAHGDRSLPAEPDSSGCDNARLWVQEAPEPLPPAAEQQPKHEAAEALGSFPPSAGVPAWFSECWGAARR